MLICNNFKFERNFGICSKTLKLLYIYRYAIEKIALFFGS